MDSRSWQSMESLEPRLMLSGTLADISELFIEQGIHSNADGGPVSHEFEIGFELEQAGLVESARFRLADQPDVWTSFELDDEGDEGEEWFWDFGSSNAADLAPWTDQEFVFEITFAGDANPYTTSVVFENPNTSQPITQPTQQPEFTSVFAYQTGVGTDTLLAWEPVTDGNINSLEAELNSFTPATQQGNGQEFEPGNATATSADTFVLTADTFYSLELLFDNGYDGVNADDIPFFVTKFTESELRFDTFTDRLSQIDEVYIERGLIEGTPEAGSIHEFGFAFVSSDPNWFTAAELTTPTGAHPDLDQWESLGEDGYEFWHEFQGDSNELADYPFGTYILTLDLPNGDRVATSFEFVDPDTGDDLSLPAAPVLNTPAHGATDVATDVTFAWDAVVDPAVTEIDLELQDANTGNHLHEWEFGPEATSHAQSELLAGQDYVVELGVEAEIDDLTNDVNIPYALQTFRSAVSEFTTETLSVDDLIGGVFFEVGENELPGDVATVYDFEFGFGAYDDQSISSASFTSPGGQTFAFNFETDLEPDPDEEWVHEWYYEEDAASMGELAAFEFGTYTVELITAGGETLTTQFVFSDQLQAPQVFPALLSPLDGAIDVPTDVTLLWSPVDDPTVAGANVYMWGMQMGGDDLEYAVDPAAGELALSGLDPTAQYSVELELFNYETSINADGLDLETSYYNSEVITFTTAADLQIDPWANIENVYMDRGQFSPPGGGTVEEFEFGIEFDSVPQWLTAAAFEYDGQWYDLTSEYVGDTDWEAEFADAAATVFGPGVYTLRLTDDGARTYTTTFTFADTFDAPTQMPRLTNPADGADNVATDVTFTWEAINDPNAIAAFLEVEPFDDGDSVIDTQLDLQDTQLPQSSLLADTHYEAELYILNGELLTNDDGIGYSAAYFTSNAIDFNTASGADPLDNISYVYIDRGMIYEGQQVFYGFEFGFGSEMQDWFAAAEFQTPLGQWHQLDASQDDDGEWIFNVVSDDPASPAVFPAGVYTLKLTLDDDSTVTTTFDLAADLEGPAGPPTMVNPLDGDQYLPTDVTFAWELPGGPALDEVMLEITDAATSETAFEWDMVGTAAVLEQNSLLPVTEYKAYLEGLVDHESTNADQIAYSTGMFAGTVTPFSTADPNDLSTLIGGIFIEEGDCHFADAEPSEYMFEFGFGARQIDTIDQARMQTPGGEWYPMQFETDTEGDWVHEWFYDSEGMDVSPNDFGAGTYVLELTLWDDTVVTTDFLFDAAVSQPEGAPEWTAPTADGQVSSDVTFAWTPVAGATGQWLEVEDEFDDDLIDVSLSPSASSYAQSSLLPGQAYLAEVGAYNLVSNVNSDGLYYSSERFVCSEIEFTTVGEYDPLDRITDLFIDRGMADVPGDGPNMMFFEFAFSSETDGWFDQAVLHTPTGGEYQLQADDDPDGSYGWLVEVASADADEVADFGYGTYTLELINEFGQSVTTDFNYSADLVAPATLPQFVSPLDGAIDVPVDAAIEWLAANDDNVNDFWFDVKNVATGEWLDINDDDFEGTSWASGPFAYATEYRAELAFVNVESDLVNEDGVIYEISAATENDIVFTTTAEFDPLAMIDGVGIYLGTSQGGTVGDPIYAFEFSLKSSETDWFTLAEVNVGDNWYSLIPDNAPQSDGYADTPDGYEWSYERLSTNAADLDEFGPGVYTLRLSYGAGEQVTTQFTFSDQLSDPEASPSFVTPTDGAIDVAPDVTFAWTPTAGPDVTDVILTLDRMDGATEIFNVNGLTDTTEYALAEPLAYSGEYEARIVYAVGEGGVNDDGIGYTTSRFAAERSTFHTVAATVDLIPAVDSVDGLDQPVLWGDEGVVNVTVANEGTATAEGQLTVIVYVSSDSSYDGADVAIGSTTAVGSLDSGAFAEFAVDVTIPEDLTDGDYYLLARVTTDEAVTEDSTANNVAVAPGGPITIQQPIADLALNVDATSYAGRVLANDAGTVTMTVTNNGTINAKGTIRTRVYISTVSEWDDSAVQIGYAYTSIDLAPGESAECEASVRIPSNTTTDSYYLIGKIDPTSYIPDRDAADNEAAWDIPLTIEAPQSDLSGEVVSVSYDGEVLPGAAGEMNLLVTNLGNTGIDQSVYVTVYASPTESLGDDAIQVAKVSTRITADADGGTSDETIALKLPTDMTAGQYYLIAVLDSLERVAESNESNNQAVSPGTINVVAPVIDLVGEIASVGFDGEVVAGASADLMVQLANIGNTAMTSKYVDLKVYLSQTLDPSDGVLVKSARPLLTLQANGENSADVKIPVTIPADTATGEFYLLVTIDETETIDEASDANNLVASATTIAVAEQVIDLVGTVDDVTLAENILAGAKGTAVVTVTNNGNTKLTSTYVRVNMYAAVGDEVDDTSILLGSQNKRVTLDAAGGETAYSFTVTTLTSMDIGSYNIIAVVDADAAVIEGDETNNEALADQALNVVAPFKDVAIEVTDFDFSEPILPGDTGTVTLTLTNNGNVSAVGSGTVTLYASADGAAGDDVELLVVPVRLSLAAYGGTTTIRKTVTIPEAVFEADQMNFVAVVETDEAIVETDLDNNTAITAGPTMDDPYRDLRGELTSTTLPQVMVAGDSGVVRAKIVNDGNIPYEGVLTLNVYAQDAADDQADPILLTAHEQNVNLRRNGGYVSVSINVDVPGTLADETEYNLFLAIDPADAIEETDEANNEVALSDQPYLFVERFGTFEDHRNVAFTLADGDVEAVFTLTGGGYGTAEVNPAGGFDIVLTGTTRSSKLTIATGEGQTAEIRSLTADGDVGTVTATTSDLVGSMTFDGALTKMVLHDVADQHVITIGESTTASDLQFNDVTDLTLATGSPISKLTVNSWLDGDGTADTVTAPYIKTLTSAGDFQANLVLSGVNAPGDTTLGKVNIAGVVDDGNDADVDWNIQAGKIGTLGIDGLVDNFALSADALGKTTLGTVGDATLTVAGDAGTVTADTWDDGAIDAASIRTLTTTGDFGASLLLSGKLNRATIGGDVIGGTWQPGEMGTMSIAGTTNGWTLDLGDGELKSMTLSEAVDTNILAGAIGVIKADSWTGGSVQGESIKTLQVTGDFSADIALTGTEASTLGTVRIGGDMLYSELDADGVGDQIDPAGWDVAGGIGTVRVDGTIDNLFVSADTLKTFTAGTVVGAWFGTEEVAMGAIGTINVSSWAEGGVRAESIKTLKVAGDLSAGLTLTGTAATTLGSVTVGGNVSAAVGANADDGGGVGEIAHAAWDVAGGIGTIKITGAVNELMIIADAIKSFTAGAVGDASMGSGDAPLGTIGTINVASWADGEIVAESIKTLKVANDFGATLTLDAGEAKAFNSATIGGGITGGDWNITGALGTMKVTGGVSNWLLNLGTAALSSLQVGDAVNMSVIAASIGRVTANSWVGGTITADSIGSIKTTGDFGASLTLADDGTKALGSVTAETITGGTWDVTGGVGSVKADAWTDGTVSAAKIGSIRLTGEFAADLTVTGAETSALGSLTTKGDVTADVVDVAGGIGTLSVNSWMGGTITAASIRSITTKADFGASLNVSSTDTRALGSVTVKGDLTGGVWTVDGGINSVKVTGQAADATINAEGQLRTMTAGSYAGTQFTVDSVGTLTSNGDMAGVSLTATQPLQDRKYAVSKMTVKGTLDLSEIRSAGSIGTVTLGAMHDSSMFAGVDAGYTVDANEDGVVDLPTSNEVLGDLDADVLAAINRFTISGSRDLGDVDLLVNSNIAAAKINNASVKQVAIDNNEEPFGFVAADTLKLKWNDGTRWQTFGRSDWPADTDDFVVDLLEADLV